MTTQLRDTQFGHLVRFFSRGRLFPYPDEIDPSLWKKSLQQEKYSTYVKSGEQSLTLEKCTNGNNSPDASTEAAYTQDVNLHDSNTSRVIEEGNDVHLVDWYGPDDPENPRNWPRSWKLLISFQVCLLNFAVYMASSIYTPGEPSIMEDFGVSQLVATLGLSFFTIGYGLGPMLWSPMSELPTLGRSPIYFWTLLAFVLLQLPTGFATNMPMFLAFRILTGFFGSPSLATGGATIADMYAPAQVAYGICIWSSFGICGPVFGPILGGFAAPAEGWRWTIWIVTWLCSFVLTLLFFLLPETSASNILYRRAERLRHATGNLRLQSQSELDSAASTTSSRFSTLGRAFKLTFTEPIVFFMDLYIALMYGLFFTWFESFPLVFGSLYNFPPGSQGLVFLGIFTGGAITVPLFLLWLRHHLTPAFTSPSFRPEAILPPTFIGAIALPVCLFWYGWTAQRGIPWILPVVGSGFFTVGIVTLVNSVLHYLGAAYPDVAASVFAGNALFRASFGASFPLFARQLFRTLGIGAGNSLLGGIAVGFIPIPYVFYRYGESIRRKSKNARHDI